MARVVDMVVARVARQVPPMEHTDQTTAMPRADPRHPVSPVRDLDMVDTAQDREVPREVRPVAQVMVDTDLVDQPSLVKEATEDTEVEVDQPREVRLVDQAMVDTAVEVVRPREARPADQEMAGTVDILVIPREVRDHRVMVDTADQEVILRVPREVMEVTDLQAVESLARVDHMEGMDQPRAIPRQVKSVVLIQSPARAVQDMEDLTEDTEGLGLQLKRLWSNKWVHQESS